MVEFKSNCHAHDIKEYFRPTNLRLKSVASQTDQAYCVLVGFVNLMFSGWGYIKRQMAGGSQVIFKYERTAKGSK